MAGMRYQPQGLLRINTNHPLARGLVGFWLPSAGGFVSALKGVPNALLSSAATIQQGPKGRRTVGNGAAAGTTIIPPDSKYRPTSAITVLVDGQAPNNNGYTIGCEDTSAITGWGIWSNAANAYLRVGSSWVGAATGVAPGAEAQYGFSYDGATFRTIANGRHVNSAAATGTITNSVKWLALNAQNGDGLNPANGKFYFLAIWDRALTAQELTAFYANPWQIFEATPKQEPHFTFFAKYASQGQQNTIITTSGSIVGMSSIAAAANAIYRSVGSASGVSGVSVPVVSIFPSRGTGSGAGNTEAESLSVTATVGQATSTVTVSGNSYSIWNVATESLGSSAALATGSTLVPVQARTTDGASIGTSDGNAKTVSFYEAVANASSQTTTSAQGAMIACAVGESTGFSSIGSLALTIYGTGALSLSASTVEAVVQSVSETVGQSESISTTSGVTAGGVFYTAVGDKFHISVTFAPYSIRVDDKPYRIKIK